MAYTIHDRYDPDPFHPFESFATLAEAEAWCTRMARQCGGSSADLLILGPGNRVSLAMPLSCHCNEGHGWGVQY